MKHFIFMLAVMSAIALQGQSETKLKLERVPADTSFYFTETIRVEGKKVSERVLPEDGSSLQKEAFRTYCGNLIKGQQNQLAEMERNTLKISDNIKFLGESLDSVCGAGSFAALATSSIKEKLQGAWTLVARNGETDIYTVVISGDVLATKDKQSAITWLDASRFRIAAGVFGFQLTFKNVEPDKYMAERTANGVTVKYTLRR